MVGGGEIITLTNRINQSDNKLLLSSGLSNQNRGMRHSTYNIIYLFVVTFSKTEKTHEPHAILVILQEEVQR